MFKSGLACVATACMMLASQSASAGFINFEGDTVGAKANGFTSSSDAGVHFFDTIGSNLQVHTHQAIGTQNLLAFGDDASRIRMTFDAAASSLSMVFGNDDACCSAAGDRAWLEVFDGATSVGLVSVVMNRNDLSDQSISFIGASFDSAVFWYGDGAGAAINLIEAIDEISFDGGGANDVPEPSSLALLGLGVAGLAALRRKQKTA